MTKLKQEQRDFEGLIAEAEAVVAVEIVSTDYRATPRDGPMVATAKVLKALKGPYTTEFERLQARLLTRSSIIGRGIKGKSPVSTA